MFIRRTQTRNTTSGETYHTRRLVRSAGVDGKVKRSDCPLVTLGLVLDGSGFVRRSEVFAGNVSEGQTLAGMLAGLNAPAGALVVMDRGIATEANRVWLREQGYRYLVVSRERSRQFDPKQATTLINAAGECLHLEKTLSEDATEVKLYGYSERRADKQTGIHTRFTQRFEAELDKIAAGLHKPRTTKRLDRLWERIGRLKAQSRGTCRSCGERCRTTASRRTGPPCASGSPARCCPSTLNPEASRNWSTDPPKTKESPLCSATRRFLETQITVLHASFLRAAKYGLGFYLGRFFLARSHNCSTEGIKSRANPQVA